MNEIESLGLLITVLLFSVVLFAFGVGVLAGKHSERNRWIRGEENDPEAARRLALLASAFDKAKEDLNRRDVPGGASRG